MHCRILCADQRQRERTFAAQTLREFGTIEEAATPDSLPACWSHTPDLVVVGAQGRDALEWIARLAQVAGQPFSVPAILLSDDGDEEIAIRALRAGFKDYLKGPVSPAQLLSAVSSCFRGRTIEAATQLVGSSESLRKLRHYLACVGSSDSTVLITGETGTGKELVAQSLHAASRRASKAFVAINCAAIPEALLESELFGHERGSFTGASTTRDGKVRQADGGTLFLDEIGEMPLCGQAKILRAIENHQVERVGGRCSIPVDFRLMAATNQNLEELVASRQFRQDLYFRLNVARVNLMPLRERSFDVPALLEHFLAEFNLRTGQSISGFTAAAMDALVAYNWPGNVRELRNTVEAALIFRPWPRIDAGHLPDHIRGAERPSAASCAEDDRTRLMDALRVTHWNKSEAARSLRWSRMTLYRKMTKYGIPDQEDGTPAT